MFFALFCRDFLLSLVNSRRFYLNKCCELKRRFLHVWHGTDQSIIDNAIDEWRGRLRACMTAKDGHFDQILYNNNINNNNNGFV